MFLDSILLSCFSRHTENQELDIIDAHPVSTFSVICMSYNAIATLNILSQWCQ